MTAEKIIRVLIAKPGLDGHDKGAKIVAKGLKDAGMEVIYTGIRQSVEGIMHAAIQEGVDVIGLSILSGSHISICRELMARLKQAKLSHTLVLVGGIIPKKDLGPLKELGIAEVFRPGAKIAEIVSVIQNEVKRCQKDC